MADKIRRDAEFMTVANLYRNWADYKMANYFSHWLSFVERTDRNKLPKIYFVNWFSRGIDGKFLWPGYGENIRVLQWICEQVEGVGKSQKTPIGNLPTPDALNLSGLNIPAENVTALLSINRTGWRKEIKDLEIYYTIFGHNLSEAFSQRLAELGRILG